VFFFVRLAILLLLLGLKKKKSVAEIAVHIYPDEAESNWYKLSKIEIET